MNAATFNYDGRTYILVTDTMSWADAEYNCVERFKGHLVSFHNATQMSAVYNGVGATGSPWIGLSDKVTEETWVWTDHSPLNFQAWGPGEPNDWASNEDCAETTATRWNDANCDTPQSSICVGGCFMRSPVCIVFVSQYLLERSAVASLVVACRLTPMYAWVWCISNWCISNWGGLSLKYELLIQRNA